MRQPNERASNKPRPNQTAVLNQVLFRLQAVDTEAVIEQVQQEGTCWVGATTWDGQPAIRLSVSNWSTTEEDITRSTAAIIKAIETLP